MARRMLRGPRRLGAWLLREGEDVGQMGAAVVWGAPCQSFDGWGLTVACWALDEGAPERRRGVLGVAMVAHKGEHHKD